MRLGVIADDFTGAVDIAGFLVQGGLRTVMCSKPIEAGLPGEFDAIVMSLKIRSIPSEEAVEQVLTALSFLKDAGCDRFYYKYCSTFDSTQEGNIAPVTDALCKALGQNSTLICPALPINGRTVFHGYLFVQDQLLSDSPMRHHPINPMLDSKLERLLAQQSPSKSGHVFYSVVAMGTKAVSQKIADLQADGVQNIIVDVINDEDLTTIAEATKEFVLVTGGSGLAQGIAKVRARELGVEIEPLPAFVPTWGKGVVIAGSCSSMMQKQVAFYQSIAPCLSVDEASCLDDPHYAQTLAKWVLENQTPKYAPLVYATRSPEQLEENRKRFAGSDVSSAIEAVFGRMSALLAKAGISNFLVGGGETSGVVATTLALDAYMIGPQIDPGVSWVRSLDGHYQLVLKSGNFGSVEFLQKAQEMYDGRT